mmetsp:Transcript_56482/g.104588  ORF Transcript_56482/g.104588 Transcript_56482/m.104588 type:complete len:218 (-) Transcript_56482:356-1009(-)
MNSIPTVRLPVDLSTSFNQSTPKSSTPCTTWLEKLFTRGPCRSLPTVRLNFISSAPSALSFRDPWSGPILLIVASAPPLRPRLPRALLPFKISRVLAESMRRRLFKPHMLKPGETKCRFIVAWSLEQKSSICHSTRVQGEPSTIVSLAKMPCAKLIIESGTCCCKPLLKAWSSISSFSGISSAGSGRVNDGKVASSRGTGRFHGEDIAGSCLSTGRT